MTYLLITKNPGGTIEGFRAVNDVVGPEAPDGLVALYAGMEGDDLAICSVWASKAQCDRFSAERLRPALDQVLGAMPDGGPPVMITFEATDERVVAQRT